MSDTKKIVYIHMLVPSTHHKHFDSFWDTPQKFTLL